MKKNKIIVAGMAVALSAGVLAGSLALYTIKDEDKTITIGGSIKTDGKLQLQEVAKPAELLHPVDHNSLTFSYALKLDTTTNTSGAFKQDTTVANVGLKFNLGAEIKSLVKVTAKVIGYVDNSYGLQQYGQALADAASDATAYIFNMENVAFKNDGTQKLEFIVSLAEEAKTFDNFITIAEKSFSYEVTLTKSTTFEPAYITGTMPDSSWQDNDKYQMAVDIDNVSDEDKGAKPWIWKGDLGGVYQAKAHFNGTWSKNNVDVSGGEKTWKWNGSTLKDLYTLDK